MERFATTVLLLTALALPVAAFLLLRPRSRLNALIAAVLGTAAGWSFNVACIFATEAIAARNTSHADSSNLEIAIAYGWACPLVLVLITWLVWHFVTRRMRPDDSPRPTPFRGPA